MRSSTATGMAPKTRVARPAQRRIPRQTRGKLAIMFIEVNSLSAPENSEQWNRIPIHAEAGDARGIVAKGVRADVLLVDGNPLHDTQRDCRAGFRYQDSRFPPNHQINPSVAVFCSFLSTPGILVRKK